MKLISSLGCFVLLYITISTSLWIIFFIVSLFFVRVQQLDGPGAGLPALYISLILAIILSFPVSVIAIFRKQKS